MGWLSSTTTYEDFPSFLESEKPVKRQMITKPMITCGSGTSHDNVCMTPSPSAPNKGHLFGKSLKSICKDGNLPAPILVSAVLVFYSFHVSYNFWDPVFSLISVIKLINV